MNVLIIIEDPKFRHALDSFLRSESVEACVFGSIDDAREHGIEDPLDLIFVSESIAGLSSDETCDAARALPGAHVARIVAVTASRTPALRSIYDAGFDGVVGPGSSADEIAGQAILAARPRLATVHPDAPPPDEPLPDEQPEVEQRSDDATSELPSVPSERGREILSTLKTLGFYLARGAPAERQAQHALHAVDMLFPGTSQAIWLRADAEDGPALVPGAGLPQEYAEVAHPYFSSLTDDEWEDAADEPRLVTIERGVPEPLRDLMVEHRFDSALHIALSSSERTVGMLAVYSPSGSEWDGHDIIALEAIASMTAVAIMHDPDRLVISPELDRKQELVEAAPASLPWEQAFGKGPLAAFLIDENGLFVATNEALSERSGISVEGMRLLSIYDLLDERDFDRVSERLTSLVGEGSNEPATLPIGFRSGGEHVIPQELTLRGLASGAEDDVTIVQGVITDPAPDMRESARLIALQDIAQIVATERVVDEAAAGVLASLSQRLGYPRGTIWLAGSDTSELHVSASLSDDAPATLPSGAGIAGRVYGSWQPEFVENEAETAGDVMCVPIVHADRIFGVLQIESDDNSPLIADDLSFFASIAAQIAGIIERDSLYQHLEHLAMTDQITGLLNRQYFQEQLDQAVATLTSGVVSVLVIGVDGFKQVNELYGHTIADDVLRQIGAELRTRVPESYHLARYTSDQFVLLLPGVDRDDAVNIAEDLRISIATHLFTVAEQVEQLTVSIGAATCPDDAETSRSLLQAADHAMYLAKRAGRNQTFQSNAAFATLAPAHGRINDLLRQSPRETLSLLIRAMDQRLPERAGHSERVTRYALAIARELGVPDVELPRLRLAAYIHDIGMVSLPDALLRKPSQLSSEERGLLRGVPVAAHGLLSQLDLNESVLLAVLHQREHFDGTGYPSGLRGENIPLGARIIAVADALDAMTSARAHREPMTLERALEQVSQQAGRQFDPDVVRAAYCLSDVISEPVSIPAVPARDDDDSSSGDLQTMGGITGELRS